METEASAEFAEPPELPSAKTWRDLAAVAVLNFDSFEDMGVEPKIWENPPNHPF